MKPDDLFDREREWADLERFVGSGASGLQVGVVYGRRRLGKSFLLRRLVREHGGLYHMALEEEPIPALQRFTDSMAVARGLRPGQLRARDWDEALRLALSGSGPGSGSGQRPLLVIDELPYLLGRPPGASIPSVLQSLVDQSRDRPEDLTGRVIVCGSAFAVMSDLLSGGRALRGRARLDMVLRPFDYRTMAEFYRIDDPTVALHLYAVVGGVPGYRDLLDEASPQTDDELEELLLDTACNPSHALFGEPSYLLREDPRITDRALYYSILSAIAAGAGTPSKVAAAVGRDVRSLAHPLDVLLTAGFVRRSEDLLVQRRPTLRVADPITRFHDLVVAPRLAAFEERRARPAWENARQSLRTQVYGPAFEEVAREWVARHAAVETLGGPVGEVGTTVLSDGGTRTSHEVDVLALAEGERRQTRNPTIRAIGEAKDSDRTRGMADLARLDRIRALLVNRETDASGARLLLFGRSGFDAELTAAASDRSDVELVDLERIRYGH